MKLHVINTGFFKLDGGAMFGVVPQSIWKNLNPPDEKNLCTWAMRCLLVESDGRLILIDTGLGNKQSEKFFSHYQPHGEDTLEASLQKLGFTSDDITDVFLTHLHFDHCGGAVKYNDNKEVATATPRLVPAFKNAVYWSNKQHWDWATNPNPREKASFLKENILPIEKSGQLKFVEVKDGVELFTGFNVKFVNGHTKAMMLPHITYNPRGSRCYSKTIVYMADLIPSSAHIPLPYVMAYDVKPLITLQEKEQFLNEAAKNNYILFFEHDPINECCTLQQTEKGIRAAKTFNLGDVK